MEQPIEKSVADQPVHEEQQTEEVHTTEENEHSSIIPRGAIFFVGAMLTFYIIYWFLVWFEIFILRGA